MAESPDGIDQIAFLGFGEAAQAFLEGWRTQSGFQARVAAYDIKTDSSDAAVREGKRADYRKRRRRGRGKRARGGGGRAAGLFRRHRRSSACGGARSPRRPAGRRCLPRLQFLRAADQGALGRTRRGGGWTLRRRRGDGAGPSLAASRAAPDQRPARAGGGAGAQSAGHGGDDPGRPGGHVVGDQDDSLGHDQGTGGAGLRMRSVRVQGRGRRSRARLARRDLSRLRLEEARRLYAGASDDSWVRRAAEMREAALTVDLLGLEGAMSHAAVGWQQRVGELRLSARDGDPADYRSLADRILARLDPSPTGEDL